MKRKVFLCIENNNNNDNNKITNALWLVRITITSLRRQMEFLEFVCFVKAFRMDETKEKQINLWFIIISCVYSYFHLPNWSVDCIDGLEFFFCTYIGTVSLNPSFVSLELSDPLSLRSICKWWTHKHYVHMIMVSVEILNFEFSIDYQFMIWKRVECIEIPPATTRNIINIIITICSSKQKWKDKRVNVFFQSLK